MAKSGETQFRPRLSNAATELGDDDDMESSQTDAAKDNAYWASLQLGDTVTMLPAEKSVFVLGRSKDCDLFVNDPQVSLKHCTFHNGDNGVSLEDHSTNGTFVNGDLVGKGKSVELKEGDMIAVKKDRSMQYKFSIAKSTTSTATAESTQDGKRKLPETFDDNSGRAKKANSAGSDDLAKSLESSLM
ncbi:hypothetical protein HDU96_001308 [Phlyctochytrium bullatum]|nr:hypothetical protein HDU96_001308 [Phlyctochytrium bullatum]